MYRYFIKTPWWVRKLFPNYTWRLPVNDKTIYLSFDDGPHPEITPWVLQQLKIYDVKASFFCIGKNVEQYPEVYKRILDEGHITGNHTQHHANGWKTNFGDYLAEVKAADEFIKSKLFRPPYGRITHRQGSELIKKGFKILMWDVLSGDFDAGISNEKCRENVLKNVAPGSIIVFHDSEKAWPHLKIVLPVILEKLKADGYQFAVL